MTSTDPAQGHFLAQLCADKAGEDFQESAYSFLVDFAFSHPTFTTAQVRCAFEAQGGAIPHDGRAWGAITRMAQRDAVIAHSGRYTRDGSHGRPNPVWTSLIVRAA